MKKILSVMLSLVLVFVGIAPALTNITVKAENPNLITDGDFESYAAGFGLTNNEFHWIDGNGINSLAWVDINSYDWTMSAYGKSVVTDVSGIGGSKALQLNSPDHVTYKVVTVEPNTLYEFSYDYYQEKQALSNPSAYGVIGIPNDATRLPVRGSNKIYISGGGTGIGTSETDAYPAVSNITTTEVTNVLGENGVLNAWTTAKLRFNSGNFTRVALPLYASNAKVNNVFPTVVVDNLSLTAVPTAEVRVNTVGAGGIGGVASVTPNNQPLEDGLELTYNACVTNEYATFLGWFKEGSNTPYKTDLTFSEEYNSSTYEVLEARFSSTVKNMINDSNFENYADGHDLQSDATNRWDGDVVKGNCATPGESGWIYSGNWVQTFITDEMAASGTKSFSLSYRNNINQSFGKVLEVEPNRNYTFSFKYYAPSGNALGQLGIRDLTGVTEFPFINGYYGGADCPSLYQQTLSTTTNDEWTTVSVNITTGRETEKIGIFMAGCTIAADTFIYLDDFYLIDTGKAADFSQINNNYKTQGRTVYKDGMPSLFYTASSFEFSANFSGDAILNLQVDSLKDGVGEQYYLTVFVDGVRSPERVLVNEAGSVNVTVAEDLPAGDHTISVYRASENYQGKMFVRGVILPESATALAAPANKDKYIEVIGDSITSGWGIVPYSGTETATSLRQDGTKTYAFLTKEALDTDISVISQSGIGIACHANGNTEGTMDQVYPVVNYGHGYKETYNHTRQPDIVIINIGTNDNHALTHSTMSANEVKEKFKEFLLYVRSKNPAANIVWVYGMMLAADSEMNTVIQNAVKEVGGEACKFYSIGMTRNTGAHAGHPDAAAHVAASEALVNFINEKDLLASTPAVDPEVKIELVTDGSFEETTPQSAGALDNNKQVWATGANYTSIIQDINSANFTGGVYAGGWIVKENTAYTFTANGIAEASTTPETPYGENMLMIRNRWNTLGKVAKVQNNKDYILTYYYYATQADHGLNGSTTKLIGLENVNTVINAGIEGNPQGILAIGVNGQVEIDGYYSDLSAYGRWVKRTIIFNSGESEKVFIPFDHQNGLMFIDNIELKEMVPVEIAYNLKESARIEIVDGIEGAPVANGSTFAFKVMTAKEVVSVTQNGTALTANADGVYEFTIDGNTTISVIVEGDENLPNAGMTADGKDLTTYNTEIYTSDISSGDTVYHEVALNYVGRNEIQLLYPISEVISVRNYGLDKHYVLGVDYEITADGKLKILEGGAIPVYNNAPIKDITDSTNDWDKSWPVSDTQHISTWGDDVIPAYGISVTYKHTTTWENGFNGFTQADQTAKIPTTVNKLTNGNDVNIVFFGDSVTVGWSSSGLNQTYYTADNATTAVDSVNVKPYASTWANMFIENLESRYATANINARNLALKGKDSAWGKDNIVARLGLISETPDLMIIAFGLNDSLDNYTSVENYKANIEAIIANTRAVAGADTEFLLVSPFLPNINCSRFDVATFEGYENALKEIAQGDSLIGVVTVTSYFKEIVKSKDVSDYLSQNINHGNDFANRIYAQSLIAATTYVQEDVEEPDYIPGDVDGKNGVNNSDLILLRRYLAGWSVEINEAAANIDAKGGINNSDAIWLARHLAGWNGYEEIPSPTPSAPVKTAFTPNAAKDGDRVMLNIALNNIEKLGGNIAGYELTVNYDANKLEFDQFSIAQNFMGDANVISEGTIKVVAYTDLPLSSDMLLDAIDFKVKDGVSGSTEITVTVDEVTSSEGVPYASALYQGGKVTVAL